jgi:hypothetical protein
MKNTFFCCLVLSTEIPFTFRSSVSPPSSELKSQPRKKTYSKMNNAVFWDVMPCGCCTNIATANVVLSSPILVTLMMEVTRSSEILVLTEPHDITSQKTAFFIAPP